MGHIGSPRAVGKRISIVALALGMSAATVACSAGSGGKRVSLQSGPARSGQAAAPGTGAGSATTGGTDTPAPTAGGTAQAPAGSATTARPGGPTATTLATPSATTATTKPKVTIPANPGPAPATPGTYRFSLLPTPPSSSFVTIGAKTTTQTVAPTTTLTVTASPGGAESWANAVTILDLAFTNSGVLLRAETVPSVSSTACTFNQPVAWPPWPLAVGKPFAGSATCGSSGSLSLQGSVIGTASVPVGATSVSTFMLKSVLTVSGTTLTITETDWYSPALRLPVQTTVTVQGGVPGFSVNSTSTYRLTP